MAFPDAMSALQRYIRAAEALAALGARLGAASGTIAPNERLLEKLEAVRAHHEPDLLDGLSEQEMDALHGFVRASLRQMLHLVELPGDGADGWTYTDPGILQAQGRSSRLVTRLVSNRAKQDPALRQILSNGAKFLDVGSGVGWISISMAQEWPGLEATGIDILEPALALARENLAGSGLADRVWFRNQNVVDIDDVEAFDVAFLPVIFIPESILADAIRSLGRALKSDGWLFAAAYRIPDDPQQATLNDLKTTLSGGRVWDMTELAQTIKSGGFDEPEDIGYGSPLHLLVARRSG